MEYQLETSTFLSTNRDPSFLGININFRSLLDKTRSCLSGAFGAIKEGATWLHAKATASLSALCRWVIEHPYITAALIIGVTAVLIAVIKPVLLCLLLKILANIFGFGLIGVLKGVYASEFCDSVLIDYRFICCVDPIHCVWRIHPSWLSVCDRPVSGRNGGLGVKA